MKAKKYFWKIKLIKTYTEGHYAWWKPTTTTAALAHTTKDIEQHPTDICTVNLNTNFWVWTQSPESKFKIQNLSLKLGGWTQNSDFDDKIFYNSTVLAFKILNLYSKFRAWTKISEKFRVENSEFRVWTQKSEFDRSILSLVSNSEFELGFLNETEKFKPKIFSNTICVYIAECSQDFIYMNTVSSVSWANFP